VDIRRRPPAIRIAPPSVDLRHFGLGVGAYQLSHSNAGPNVAVLAIDVGLVSVIGRALIL